MSKKGDKNRKEKRLAARKKVTQEKATPGSPQEVITDEGCRPLGEPKPKKGKKAPKPERAKVDLEALRSPVEEAKTALDKAQVEAKEMTEKARALVAQAKEGYLKALAPYRAACLKAKVPCEYSGGRSTNVSETVRFEVEKVSEGVRVLVKGKPETEEVIPMEALKESIGKASYAYVDRWIGPREQIGNKGGSLSNRLRAVLNG